MSNDIKILAMLVILAVPVGIPILLVALLATLIVFATFNFPILIVLFHLSPFWFMVQAFFVLPSIVTTIAYPIFGYIAAPFCLALLSAVIIYFTHAALGLLILPFFIFIYNVVPAVAALCIALTLVFALSMFVCSILAIPTIPACLMAKSFLTQLLIDDTQKEPAVSPSDASKFFQDDTNGHTTSSYAKKFQRIQEIIGNKEEERNNQHT